MPKLLFHWRNFVLLGLNELMFWANQANTIPDSKFLGANMGPIWVRQDPGGPHVGPMNLAMRDDNLSRAAVVTTKLHMFSPRFI